MYGWERDDVAKEIDSRLVQRVGSFTRTLSLGVNRVYTPFQRDMAKQRTLHGVLGPVSVTE